MTSLALHISNLLSWYQHSARPFLNDPQLVQSDRLVEMDNDAERLRQSVEKLDTELVVCFLGNSGVGKSTLLNAIVNDNQPLVPSGGVGPLTAQAVVVQYADQPRIKVEYQNIQVLQRTIFGLEQMYKAELGQLIANTPGLIDTETRESQNEEIDLDLDDFALPSETEQDSARKEKREQWRRRAQLLVTGSQDDERSPQYLIDSLREAIGKQRQWGTTTDSRDERNVYGIKEILSWTLSIMTHSTRLAQSV